MRTSSLAMLSALLLSPAVALAADDEWAPADFPEQDAPPPSESEGDWQEAPPPRVQAPENAAPVGPPPQTPTLRDFEATLSPNGRWVWVPGLGRVWQPSPELVGDDFVPYVTGGEWANTQVGWVFQTRWSWGWAPFHYGRWHLAPQVGWVWWPGYEWAPSWVDWRRSGGYVAWAPRPPPGLRLSFGFGVPGWAFSPHRYFGHSRHVFYPRWSHRPGYWGGRGGWGWSRQPGWGHRRQPERRYWAAPHPGHRGGGYGGGGFGREPRGGWHGGGNGGGGRHGSSSPGGGRGHR